eukprot:g7134.t1 g7134   contig23:1942865-1943268(-)
MMNKVQMYFEEEERHPSPSSPPPSDAGMRYPAAEVYAHHYQYGEQVPPHQPYFMDMQFHSAPPHPHMMYVGYPPPPYAYGPPFDYGMYHAPPLLLSTIK